MKTKEELHKVVKEAGVGKATEVVCEDITWEVEGLCGREDRAGNGREEGEGTYRCRATYTSVNNRRLPVAHQSTLARA